ncbi:M56 family metallopeptidase [Tenacibaculum tangerinum]|uniref:M56 family metallopeptidase n=1 Tax=Tenacibaculum tangerinum TaxID=3038772 RepID=A0ABY8L266_9FLAO|nr:M56 family metallopeptidase [Tenacibaculum tangerinum]WGH74069.1 M56 family metallopeptidase [Tenacibaculum tangerinum]
MITYFIKSGICLALLLVFYHLVLEREKMHQFNRFYLLGSVLFSFVAPLYKIYIEVPLPASKVFVPTTINNTLTTEVVTPQIETINYTQFLWFAYLLIASILLIRFLKNLRSIYIKVKRHQKIKKEKATLVLVDDNICPHTFWNYIFINKEEYNSNKIETELYTHELTHATQKHTFDVVLIELLHVVFWINPIFIFLKKAMKLNHEFLADTNVITTCKNTTKYQYLLLNRAAWNNEYYLASNLNYVLTKKRLLMMTKQSSRINMLLKKLAVIPLFVGSTFLFAERVAAYENNSELLDAEITKSELPKEIVPTDSSVLENSKEKLKKVTSLPLSSDDKTQPEKFLAAVKRDGDHVHLSCYNCKRWAGLDIPLNKEFIITDWGFSNNSHVAISEYAFTIKATEKEIFFKGLKNTAWLDLSFTLHENRTQYLNQSGMVAMNKKDLKIRKDNFNLELLREFTFRNSTYKISHKTNGDAYYRNYYQLTEKEKSKLQPSTNLNKEQQKAFEEFKNLKALNKLPPVKTVDIILSYRKFVDKIKFEKVYRKGDFISLNNIYKKLSKNQKALVEKPSSVFNATKTENWNINDSIPKPPANNKTGYKYVNNQTLFYVKNDQGITYYNRWGQVVTKEGKIINPAQTASDKIIPSQNIAKVHKDDKVVSEFKKTNVPPLPSTPNFPEVKKGEVSNIPPPNPPTALQGEVSNIPPPPKPIPPLEYIKKHKGNNTEYYYNGKKISYKKAIKILEANSSINLQSWHKNGKATFKLSDEPITIKI